MREYSNYFYWDNEREVLKYIRKPSLRWSLEMSSDLLDDIPEDWVELASGTPSGYYLLTYTVYRDCDYGDFGSILAEYDVLSDLVSMKSSFIKARFARCVNWFVDLIYGISQVFKAHWSVDFDYGGAGLRTSDMYLPKALWIRWGASSRYAHWGPGYTLRLNSPFCLRSWWDSF